MALGGLRNQVQRELSAMTRTTQPATKPTVVMLLSEIQLSIQQDRRRSFHFFQPDPASPASIADIGAPRLILSENPTSSQYFDSVSCIYNSQAQRLVLIPPPSSPAAPNHPSGTLRQ